MEASTQMRLFSERRRKSGHKIRFQSLPSSFEVCFFMMMTLLQVIHKMRTLVELQKFKMKTGTKRRAPLPPNEVGKGLLQSKQHLLFGKYLLQKEEREDGETGKPPVVTLKRQSQVGSRVCQFLRSFSYFGNPSESGSPSHLGTFKLVVGEPVFQAPRMPGFGLKCLY